MKYPTVVLLAAMALCAQGTASAQPMLDPVVVSQGSVELHFSDIDARVGKIPPDKRAGVMDKPARIEQLLTNLLLVKHLANEAREMGVDQDPLVAAQLKLAQDEILAQSRIAALLADIDMPDFSEAARERYLSGPEKYRTQPTATVRQLAVLSTNHGEVAARQRAEELRAQFMAEGGADFDAFIRRHSEEKIAAATGGVVEGLRPGSTNDPFEQAALALDEPGELSPVVKSRYGYHVIQLIKKVPAQQRSFEQVRSGIVASLEKEYRERQRTELLDRLKAQPMEADPELVQSLRRRYYPGGEGARVLSGASATTDATGDADGSAPADSE